MQFHGHRFAMGNTVSKPKQVLHDLPRLTPVIDWHSKMLSQEIQLFSWT